MLRWWSLCVWQSQVTAAMIVRKLRLQRGWSQDHLAELTGLSTRTIQRIERGHKYSLETKASLAAVFEVDPSTFDEGEPDMNERETLTSAEREAIEYVKGIKEFYSHLLMYLVFMAAFTVFFGFKNPLIPWGAIGWGIGVIVHGLVVYEVINVFGPKWEKRQIDRRLGRDL